MLWTRELVTPTGFEPVTYRLGICRSIRLSYGATETAYSITRYFCQLAFNPCARLPSARFQRLSAP